MSLCQRQGGGTARGTPLLLPTCRPLGRSQPASRPLDSSGGFCLVVDYGAWVSTLTPRPGYPPGVTEPAHYLLYSLDNRMVLVTWLWTDCSPAVLSALRSPGGPLTQQLVSARPGWSACFSNVFISMWILFRTYWGTCLTWTLPVSFCPFHAATRKLKIPRVADICGRHAASVGSEAGLRAQRFPHRPHPKAVRRSAGHYCSHFVRL